MGFNLLLRECLQLFFLSIFGDVINYEKILVNLPIFDKLNATHDNFLTTIIRPSNASFSMYKF